MDLILISLFICYRYSYFQYGQDPLLRQLSEQTRENYDLPPPASRGDPLLRQLVRNGDYKVVNLEPPRPLTNTFQTLREAVSQEIFRSIFIKLFKLERYFDIVAQIGSAQITYKSDGVLKWKPNIFSNFSGRKQGTWITFMILLCRYMKS